MLRTDLITIDPEITGGTPVFTGTRVPISRLFSYLRHGHPLDEFLDDYPTVEKEQAQRVLDVALSVLLPDYLKVEPAQIDFSYTEKRDETAA
ncbi:DUF433 domain-containing protein [Hymenobacter sp.]|jgi:uncharacterized protein (DUF433 family)|uniref:DUF433 domain-containing protein n=1 Tax=Hymenobacter sp. TaxID=1898978 RepID=UPI002EDABD57